MSNAYFGNRDLPKLTVAIFVRILVMRCEIRFYVLKKIYFIFVLLEGNSMLTMPREKFLSCTFLHTTGVVFDGFFLKFFFCNFAPTNKSDCVSVVFGWESARFPLPLHGSGGGGNAKEINHCRPSVHITTRVSLRCQIVYTDK